MNIIQTCFQFCPVATGGTAAKNSHVAQRAFSPKAQEETSVKLLNCKQGHLWPLQLLSLNWLIFILLKTFRERDEMCVTYRHHLAKKKTPHSPFVSFHSVLLQTKKIKKEKRRCVIIDMFHCHSSFDRHHYIHSDTRYPEINTKKNKNLERGQSKSGNKKN